MTWVQFRKYFYAPLLALVFAGALAIIWLVPTDQRPLVTGVVIVALLAPGFIARHLLRDLFASRALIAAGQYRAAFDAAQKFLQQLRRRPWVRHAIWAQYGMYTLSTEAMALNNGGAALLELRRFAEARAMLERARAVDPAYPIPLYNLAVIAKLEGDESESQRLISEAAARGFAGGQLDAIVQAVGEAHARLAAPRSNA